tara:strand:- start:594 stop:800 length:207 start_codon:yes stop_codon:yes gene_type:complete
MVLLLKPGLGGLFLSSVSWGEVVQVPTHFSDCANPKELRAIVITPIKKADFIKKRRDVFLENKDIKGS